MEELKNLCYELLAKYASAKAWISDMYCRTDEETQKQAVKDHDEVNYYRERIEAAANMMTDNYIGLTD